MFIVTHLINIRSWFCLEIFSMHYFPLYQVLLQIAASFCKQGFLSLFLFSCVPTAVAQWKTDLWLGSKVLLYYRQTMTITIWTAEICSLYVAVSFLRGTVYHFGLIYLNIF